jgi:hypothetical protein
MSKRFFLYYPLISIGDKAKLDIRKGTWRFLANPSTLSPFAGRARELHSNGSSSPFYVHDKTTLALAMPDVLSVSTALWGFEGGCARVAELADALDSGSSE